MSVKFHIILSIVLCYSVADGYLSLEDDVQQFLTLEDDEQQFLSEREGAEKNKNNKNASKPAAAEKVSGSRKGNHKPDKESCKKGGPHFGSVGCMYFNMEPGKS